MRLRSCRCAAGAVMLGAAGVLLLSAPAEAQESDDPIGQVDISFDVGDFDPRIGDWVIDAVEVTGDLEDGQPFTVEILAEGDEVLWSGTQPYTDPVTRIVVDRRVAVGEVTSAGVSQAQTLVEGVQIDPPEVTHSASGGGGSGQLALSMVMAVIIVAIVFRSPLPSQSTERWTK